MAATILTKGHGWLTVVTLAREAAVPINPAARSTARIPAVSGSPSAAGASLRPVESTVCCFAGADVAAQRSANTRLCPTASWS